MKQIGLEAEYFVGLKVEKLPVPVIVPQVLPHDETGILVEVRGKPGNPYEAVGSFVGEYFNIRDKLDKLELKMLLDFRYKLSAKLKIDISREFAKGIYKARNLYSDNKTHRKSTAFYYAGLHIHFSNNKEYKMYTPDGQFNKTMNFPQIMDIPNIVRKMDEKYKDTITPFHRNIGCYEIKEDNFEYRSFPTYHINEIEDITGLLHIAQFAYGLM